MLDSVDTKIASQGWKGARTQIVDAQVGALLFGLAVYSDRPDEQDMNGLKDDEFDFSFSNFVVMGLPKDKDAVKGKGISPIPSTKPIIAC